MFFKAVYLLYDHNFGTFLESNLKTQVLQTCPTYPNMHNGLEFKMYTLGYTVVLRKTESPK